MKLTVEAKLLKSGFWHFVWEVWDGEHRHKCIVESYHPDMLFVGWDYIWGKASKLLKYSVEEKRASEDAR